MGDRSATVQVDVARTQPLRRMGRGGLFALAGLAAAVGFAGALVFGLVPGAAPSGPATDIEVISSHSLALD